LEEGQIVRVKVTEIDRQGRVRLSMKEIEQADGSIMTPKAEDQAAPEADDASAEEK
jgi:predicted RNA-binding protein with RPS1 domain